MAYPTRLLTDDEHVLKDFNPHWRVLLLPIAMAVVMLLVAGIATWAASLQGWAISGWIWLVALLAATVFALPRVIAWKYTQYVLTSERIIVRSGVVARSGTEIPLENINNVLFNQTAMERALRYGDVLVESAGSMGQSRLANIPDPERFQSEIYRAREARTSAIERMGHDPRPDSPGGSQGVDHRQPSVVRDVPAQLESLSNLHDAGKLTDQEFETQKRRLLDG